MEPYTELTKTVNELMRHGYRCQLSRSDFAVLAKHQNGSETIKIVTVSADGTVDHKPLGTFLEEMIQ